MVTTMSSGVRVTGQLKTALLETALGLALLGMLAGCDSMLLAPTSSTIRVTSSSQVVPIGGSTQIQAQVIESAGTPVQNGTTVRFTTDLGEVQPVEAETRNGVATVTFLAGTISGVAQIRATSGGAGPADDGGALASNVVQIVVGAAAVDTVILGANPSSVPSTGGTVELLATVVSVAGQLLGGVPVTFVTSQGQLSAPVVVTDDAGQARTQLTTTQNATVTASAGAVTSGAATVTVLAPAPVATATIVAADNGVTVGVGHQWTFTAQVTACAGAPQPTTYAWDFGDGIGATNNSNVTSHVYGASTANTARIVRVTITLSDGSELVASTEILIGAI
jgi:hypothetical protein